MYVHHSNTHKLFFTIDTCRVDNRNGHWLCWSRRVDISEHTKRMKQTDTRYKGSHFYGVSAKIGCTWPLLGQNQLYDKTSTRHTPGALLSARLTSQLMLSRKSQDILEVFYCLSSFQLILANFEPISKATQRRTHCCVSLRMYASILTRLTYTWYLLYTLYSRTYVVRKSTHVFIHYMHTCVPGAVTWQVARVPIKISFVGSSLAECLLVGSFSCIKINDQREARGRELATFR